MICMFSQFAMVCRHAADVVARKQAVWGSSFGWESAATWRAVWPTPYAPNASPIFVHLGQQSESSSNYPHLVICESLQRDQASFLTRTQDPAAYPHLDIYPTRATIVEVEESQTTKKNQCTVNLVPHYPNLVICKKTPISLILSSDIR